LTNPELGALGALFGVRSLSFLDPIDLEARGRRIHGELRIKPVQLERLLTYAEELVRQWTGRRVSAPAPAPTGPPVSPPPRPARPQSTSMAAPPAPPAMTAPAPPPRRGAP
jgi:hypothetical protein